MDTLTADTLAASLQESKKALLARVLRTLGQERCQAIFAETCAIESQWWHADQRWRSPAYRWRDLLPPGTAAVQQGGTRPALSVPGREETTAAAPAGAV